MGATSGRGDSTAIFLSFRTQCVVALGCFGSHPPRRALPALWSVIGSPRHRRVAARANPYPREISVRPVTLVKHVEVLTNVTRGDPRPLLVGVAIAGVFVADGEQHALHLGSLRGDGIDATGDGIDPTGDGIDPIGDGIDPINDGIDPIDDGIDPIGDGIDPINDGIDPIDDGIDPIGDGIDPINDGIDPIDDGIDPIGDGIDPINDGIDPIDDGIDPINDGIDPIDDGIDPTGDGIDVLQRGLDPIKLGERSTARTAPSPVVTGTTAYLPCIAVLVFEKAAARLQFLAYRFLLVTLIGAGALTGVVAVLFHRYVELARNQLIGRALRQPEPWRVILMIVTPAIMFALLAALIRRFAPRAVGANLARVRMAYNDNPRILGPRTIITTFAATPLSLGAGAPLGPEGPIVVVASGISVTLARLLRLPQKVVRGMIPIGTAAGIAAIFNTPITGVVFALEEIIGTSQRGILGGVLVGSVAAAVVERVLLGGRPMLVAPSSTWTDVREMAGFAVLGIAAGAASGLAISLAHRLKRKWSAAMPSIVLRAALAGLLIGAAGLLAPEIFGIGYDSVSLWLHGGGSASGTGIAFAVKLLAFTVAISGGVIGGTFAPSLFIGSALGAAIGHGTQDLFPSMHIDPKAYAIVGMGSYFAGVMRSPIAAVLIVVELTRDYELIVPLMLGVSLAVAISRRISRLSIVEPQMVDEGWIEEHAANDPLARVRVRQAMTTNVVTISRDTTIEEIARLIAGTRFTFYPI